MNHDEILRKLTALDFIAVDLALFLDTHPDDREALDKYNEHFDAGQRFAQAI